MNDQKRCCTCREVKLIALFSRNRSTRDGRSYRCKACDTEYKNSEHYQKNIMPKIRLRQKQYRKTDEWRKYYNQYRKQTRASETNRARERRHSKLYQLKYPEKQKAKRKLRAALNAGLIERPSVCEGCGIADPKRSDGATAIHGHHSDYSKPLDVIWLCVHCHTAEHSQRAEKGQADEC